MSSLQKQLLQKVVLNEEDISELRKRVHVRHATASSKQKAKILAGMIHRMIDGSLPNFSKETKNSIRIDLLKKKIQSKSLTISAHDIVESSILLAVHEERNRELSQWITHQVGISSKLADIYIDELLKSFHTTVYSKEPAFQTDILKEEVPTETKRRGKKVFFLGITVVILLIFVVQIMEFPFGGSMDSVKEDVTEKGEVKLTERVSNDLPAHLQYKDIDTGKLRDWLLGRNSLLADEPYFSSILKVAAEFNVNPLLLFAVTGQEQGFVSREHEKAREIANNPFNVFHSWEEFNTDITESSQIAARTMINLSKDRPENVDPIQWINRKYAEDENWWKGVSAIFLQLEDAVK